MIGKKNQWLVSESKGSLSEINNYFSLGNIILAFSFTSQ